MNHSTQNENTLHNGSIVQQNPEDTHSHSHSPASSSDDSQSHSHLQNQAPLAGQPHSHSHPHGLAPSHGHQHTHSHQQTQAVLNRMSRAIGHMEAVKRMVEDGRDCSEVLIQIAAVRSAINNIGKIILEDHISHCIVDAVEHGDNQALDNLKKAIETFIK